MRRSFLPYIITILCSLFLCSCTNQKQYKIGVSQCSDDDWRRKLNEELGREILFHPEATIEIRSARDDNATQIADIRYFLDNDFDIIIAAPNEADAITPIITEAYRGGTPVIIFDRNVNGNEYTAFQGADNEAIGRAAAEYMRKLAGDNARILEIEGLMASTPAIERSKGFHSNLGSMKVVVHKDAGWTYEKAAVVADSLLNLYPDVDAIFAHNDRMAMAAADVARRKGMDVKVVGVDAAPEIGLKAVADHQIDATFIYPSEGHRLIRTALSILNNEPYDTVLMLPALPVVDRSNADLLISQNQVLGEETDRLEMLKRQLDLYWSQHNAQRTFIYAAIVILVLLLVIMYMLLRAYWSHKHHQEALMAQNNQLARQKLQLEQKKQQLEEQTIQLAQMNEQLKEQTVQLEQMNEQLNAATQSKLMFFTNVSHDLRTPLTLIAEPVAQLAAADNLTPHQHTMAAMANKNVRILRRLINQVLDFRKYENGAMDVNLTEVDFGATAREWVESFNTLARERDIHLNIDIPAEPMLLALDAEKMERVVFNLLSNAFKYTPANGTITFHADLSDGHLNFFVRDTGDGIALADQARIFDRFFMVDRVHSSGSGIGLSVAKAFVDLHGGTISLESAPGQGTTFTVSLPVRHVEKCEDAVTHSITAEDVGAELGSTTQEAVRLDDSKLLALVIDDNEDIRRMVAALLGDKYNVIQAADGADGLRAAAKYVPDIVISDVMMPGMDGLECCRRIKDEVSTSHIPVLLLTACALDEQRADGYRSGADGYVSKPFSAEVLLARCESLIDNRRRIRNLYTASDTTPAPAGADPTQAVVGAEPVRADIDNDFYNRFLAYVHKNLSDCDLAVDAIAGELGLGRSQLYRKIKALTNYSPVELIRNIRLKEARRLLTTTDLSISEIAYEVGFSTPTYFTKCFREAYNETPTDLRDHLSGK